MGIVGFRALMIIGVIAGFSGFFAGVTSTDAVNVAKSSKAKNQAWFRKSPKYQLLWYSSEVILLRKIENIFPRHQVALES